MTLVITGVKVFLFLLEKQAHSGYTELAEFADLLHVSGCPVP